MTENYDAAIDFVLDHEGRIYENVKGDPGGPTKWGITTADYAQWRHEQGLPVRPVKQATEAEILAIYKAHYWAPLRGDSLPAPLDLVLFDSAVNVGTTKAVRWLQIELGVTVDGNLGANTLAAVKRYEEKHSALVLAAAVIQQRRDFYANLAKARPSLKKFLTGWLNRVGDLDRVVNA